MPSFSSNGIDIAFETWGDGAPVLLIHGFGSSARINWLDTGWVATLSAAGYRSIAVDNRGHGRSQKLHDPNLYFAHQMADDAARLLDHLRLDRLPVVGYSMGARIAAFLALRHPGRVERVVFGGLGLNLVAGLRDAEAIVAGLTAESLDEITNPVARRFRVFAEHSRADRAALAACMISSREPFLAADLGKITMPALVAVGETDDIAGDPAALAAQLPAGQCFVIPRRDHMLATGDPAFKARVVAFLNEHA